MRREHDAELIVVGSHGRTGIRRFLLGSIAEHVSAEGRDAVISDVAGMAYETGTATFTLDPRDPLGTGFTLR